MYVQSLRSGNNREHSRHNPKRPFPQCPISLPIFDLPTHTRHPRHLSRLPLVASGAQAVGTRQKRGYRAVFAGWPRIHPRLPARKHRFPRFDSSFRKHTARTPYRRASSTPTHPPDRHTASLHSSVIRSFDSQSVGVWYETPRRSIRASWSGMFAPLAPYERALSQRRVPRCRSQGQASLVVATICYKSFHH